jgi:hypothetical protein
MWVETCRAKAVVESTNTGTVSTPSAKFSRVKSPQKDRKPPPSPPAPVPREKGAVVVNDDGDDEESPVLLLVDRLMPVVMGPPPLLLELPLSNEFDAARAGGGGGKGGEDIMVFVVVAEEEGELEHEAGSGGGVSPYAMPLTSASNSGLAEELRKISADVVCSGNTNTTPT